jgi:hypothetical protein
MLRGTTQFNFPSAHTSVHHRLGSQINSWLAATRSLQQLWLADHTVLREMFVRIKRVTQISIRARLRAAVSVQN